MIEKLFMACADGVEGAEQYGPFNTAEEAETQTLRLGWDWVCVTTHTVDEFGTVMDVKTRFYRPEGVRQERAPSDVEAIRRMVLPSPLTEDEVKFFAQYEEQMSNTKVEDVPKVDWRKDSRMGVLFRRMGIKTDGKS
jgi:hypothetical protein